MKKRCYMRGQLALAIIVGLIAMSGVPWVNKATAQTPATLTVYDPTGAFEVTQTFAPRLPDLNGKTICELSNDSWETYRTFPVIRELLQRQFPTAKFIPWDQFPHGNVAERGIDNDETIKKVKAAGCQAVIVGNAG